MPPEGFDVDAILDDESGNQPDSRCPSYGSCLATADMLEESDRKILTLSRRISTMKAGIEDCIGIMEIVEHGMEEEYQRGFSQFIDRLRGLLVEPDAPEGSEEAYVDTP
jgi:hypothetical protein